MNSRDEALALDAADPLAHLREQFSIPPGLIYLDGNSLGVMPKATPARVQQVVTQEWGVGLIGSWNSAGWMELAPRIGDKIARLIGARPGECVATDSTSVNLFKVLNAALSIAHADDPKRRRIVSERGNFPTDLYIAEATAAERGCELVLADDPEALPGLLDERCAVLMLTHVNYANGRMHDMSALTKAAHDAGALALWDLAHSAGAVPVDLTGSGADFAIGCGYKYLNGGPGAPAFVWVAPRHAERFWQPLAGWMGHAAPFEFTPGYRPAGDENRYNAWYVKATIQGAPGGKLAGKTVAVKDNVCVAGVPMMNGASILEGYTPDVDATVVTRLLDAGATIAGKAHCEYYCFSGGSHTSAAGPVHNPHRRGYSAGGSSSGSAALVAAGEVDMAIGGDQGGSIRMPAAYCGIVGMKPTWGLVPYSGIMPIELTLDHAGPMTANVADNALMLEVMAGIDGLDPRQGGLPATLPSYTATLGQGAGGLRVGVVQEGFGLPNSEADVDDKVRAAAAQLRRLGATVEEVSLPMHLVGPAIWTPIACEGATQQMMKDNGHGFNWKGLYVTSLVDAHSAWRHRADELSDTLKLTMLVGEWFIQSGRGRYYAKAQNLARQLRAAYDAALSRYDVLLMPTLPVKATPLPPPDAPRALYVQRAFEMLANTCPTDVTGHPALQLPCGVSDGLPVGMMLIGRHFDEATLYRAAAAFEQAVDWKRA